MLAGGFSPVYPCHVPAAQMRTHPIGTGPFKFAELQAERIDQAGAQSATTGSPAGPISTASSTRIIPNRATSMLAFVAGKFDLTFTAEMTPALLKDLKAQAPQMRLRDAADQHRRPTCWSTATSRRSTMPRIRRAMGLAIDRKAFSDILSQGINQVGGAMLPPPEGLWGMPPDFLATVAGYGADVEKSREEGRRIMRELGYGPDKPLPHQGFDPQHPALPRRGGDPDRPSEERLHSGRARAARHRASGTPAWRARTTPSA